jgi:hypothetical protein
MSYHCHHRYSCSFDISSHVAPKSPSAFPSRHDGGDKAKAKTTSPPPTTWKRVSGNIMTEETKGNPHYNVTSIVLCF